MTARPAILLAMLLAMLALVGCGSTPAQRGAGGAGRPAINYTPLTEEQAHDIAIHALGLVGTPYRYGGNTPEGGFDCSGLIGYVYRHSAGVPPPRTVAQLGQWGQSVSGSELRTGALVVFGSSHAGSYVGEGRVVHAPSTGGTVRMDHLRSRYWARQSASFRRP